jgi:prolyl oligopeptidase
LIPGYYVARRPPDQPMQTGARHANHAPNRPRLAAQIGNFTTMLAIGGAKRLWSQTMSVDDRPTIAAPDDDPYLWLEEIEGERALDFVGRQNARTLEKFGNAGFARDRDTLAAIYDRPDNIPYVTRRGCVLTNFWKDVNNPRGIWRSTTLDEFRKANPEWETLLDVDKLAVEENQDWILTGIQTQTGAHPRAILSLSRGGSDAATLREFDTDTRAFVADGFTLPEAKGGAQWFDTDTLLLSSAYGEGRATTSGYARTVRLWRRGTDVDQAPVVFETAAANMAAYCDIDRTGASLRVWFVERLDFFNHHTWLGNETGAQSKLDLPTDIWMEAHRDWLVVKRRAAWTVGGKTYPGDTVLGMSLSAFIAGDRNFSVVFEPGPRRALQGFFWSDGRLVLPILD